MKLFFALLGYGSMLIAMNAQSAGTVVLLHGMGRTSFSMARLARALEIEGYSVVNATYPSRTQPLEKLATEWLPARLRDLDGSQPLHFVTHSLGGIIVRLWLRECGAPENFGRVVMLAPPNAGSEVTDRFESFASYRWFTGINGHRLGTANHALPRTLGKWPMRPQESDGNLGVIAGARSINPFTAAWLPSPNDGKVSVASTHLAGERDHVVLPYSHTWLGWRSETISQVSAFLRQGEFIHGRAQPIDPLPQSSPP